MDVFVRDVDARWTSPRSIPKTLYQSPDRDEPRGKVVTHYEESQILRQRLIPPEGWPRDVREWHEVWSDWMRQTHRMDYTAWLEACLVDRDVLPEQAVVCVDEAQDHTPLQLAVLRSWNTEHMVMWGDDDQCLYAFTGADPARFFDHPVETESVLSQSYRIPPAVHLIASSITSKMHSRAPKEYTPAGHAGRASMSPLSLEDPRLLDRIAEMEGSRMVLATCEYMLADLVSRLREIGVAFHNPYRKIARAWNPLDAPSERLEAYLSGEMTGSAIASWADMLPAKAYRPEQRTRFIEEMRTMRGRNVLRSRLAQAFHDHSMKRIARRDPRLFTEFPRTSLPSWKYMLNVLRRGDDWRDPQVVVGTIHSVKGGEADTVLIAPDMSPAAFREAAWDPDTMLRTFYVGVTRARHNLSLLAPSYPTSVDWRRFIT